MLHQFDVHTPSFSHKIRDSAPALPPKHNQTTWHTTLASCRKVPGDSLGHKLVLLIGVWLGGVRRGMAVLLIGLCVRFVYLLKPWFRSVCP